jgi:hypothetical protein
MISLPDLHDATLKSVHFEWENARALLTFKIAVAAHAVTVVEAEGVTILKCPRLLPWGPSSSVNSTALETLVDGQSLIVEMQSGDVIEIRCREVAIRSPLQE